MFPQFSDVSCTPVLHKQCTMSYELNYLILADRVFQQSLSVSNNNSPSGTQTTDAVEGIFEIVIMNWINWIQLKSINNVCNCNGFNSKRL